MLIYHLADLHFGKNIYGIPMLEDQRFFTQEFLKKCQEKKPDAVIIAGDVYDRSAPSGEAIALLDHFLTSLAQMDITVLLIAGNHDSGQRLSFGRTMLAKSKIHIAGTVEKTLEKVTLSDEYGPLDFYLLPYTFTEQLSELLDEEFPNYQAAFSKYLSMQEIDENRRNVLIAHQNVTCDGKEAERGGSETMVGGVGQIDYHTFDSFDYVALGHIHSSYPVGRESVRYAGTPLPYHLSETRQADKGFVEVELREKGDIAIQRVGIKPLHKMRSLSGSRDEIYELLRNDQGHDEYIGITINDQRITPEISTYLRGLLQTRDSLLIELISTYHAINNMENSITSADVENKSLEDLFSDFYSEQSGGNPPDDKEYEVLSYVGELIRNSEPDKDERNAEKIYEKLKKIGGGK